MPLGYLYLFFGEMSIYIFHSFFDEFFVVTVDIVLHELIFFFLHVQSLFKLLFSRDTFFLLATDFTKFP